MAWSFPRGHRLHVSSPLLWTSLETFWLKAFLPCREAKCERSKKFAAENGLPELNNVLLPKTKGFVSCLEELDSSLDAGLFIYFCWFASVI